jgi:mRNA interferase MazF
MARHLKSVPFLILWIDAGDVIVAAVTSAIPRSVTDLSLVDWKAAGLRVASTVRLSRLDCLEQILLRQKLGTLSLNDAQRIKQTWTNQIRLQF